MNALQNIKIVRRLFTYFVLSFLFPFLVMGQTSIGPNNAGTMANLARAGSSTSWTNTGNASASDNVYVSIPTNGISTNGAYTDYFHASNFGFAIPAGVTITGIEVQIERTDVNNAKDDQVSIVKGGTIGSEDKSVNPAWSSEAIISYGSNSDTWSETWTPSDINSSDFGVVFSVRKQGGGANPAPQIDHITISVTYTGIPLPIELISFSAQRNNEGIDIQWSTATETDNDYFTIECSNDGIDWDIIHSLDGAGNSSRQINYYFNDNMSTGTTIYYRLKQTDFDGTYTYSDIVSVDNLNLDAEVFKVYPNPTIDKIVFERSGRVTHPIQVFDLQGKKMSIDITNQESSNFIEIDLSKLRSGAYLVTSGSYTKVIYKSGNL